MALDLFFVSRKQDFADARAAGFFASDAQVRARRTLLKAIAGKFPGAAIDGKATDGPVAGFPRGELVAYPGYLHWSLHGADEREPISAIVDWFHDQGLVCEDPQGVGFGNRERVQGRQNLDDWDVLVGARLVSIEISEPGVTGLILTWMLADGREAQLCFIHHVACDVPANLTTLIRDTVAQIVFEPTGFHEIGGRQQALSDNLRFVFASGAQIRCLGTVTRHFFAQPAGRSKW
jgi:hypothetical protein